VRYHHIFSPVTGYPVQNELLSVTIITEILQTYSSMDADALSTAVFILGYERGLALVNSLPGIEAVFVLNDKNIRTTPGVNFTLIDRTFAVNE
jgi:thiamine biosynthesis lipoprotein